MTKTNHRRGFKAPNFIDGQKSHGYTTFYGHGETPLSGHRVNASATVAPGNSRSIARDKKGAKKFVNSRTRFHEDAALRRLVKDMPDASR